MGAMIHIHDLNWRQEAKAPRINSVLLKKGLKPRDFDKQPLYSGHLTPPNFPLVNMNDVPKMIEEKDNSKSWLSDLRKIMGENGGKIPSRDQNGRGYCWQHSGVSALILVRARENLTYADLSAYGPACVIKNFRDEGGWGAQGVDFLCSRGCPTSKTWPQQGTSRSYDNDATWAEAANYKVVEGFWDLDQAQYDRNLTWQQVVTCLLFNIPVVCDFNWWSHSVCGIKLVNGASRKSTTRVETGKLADLKTFEKIWGLNDPVLAGIALQIWNSWGDSWSDQGEGVLSGSRSIPNGSVAPRTSTIYQQAA